MLLGLLGRWVVIVTAVLELGLFRFALELWGVREDDSFNFVEIDFEVFLRSALRGILLILFFTFLSLFPFVSFVFLAFDTNCLVSRLIWSPLFLYVIFVKFE